MWTDMQELEKIIQEMQKIKEIMLSPANVDCFGEPCKENDCLACVVNNCMEIVKNHMNGGWIPVEKELPPLGQRLQATILHHEWVSDYDSSWVPPEEKIHHPEYTEVCEIYSVGAMWYYDCAEDDYHRDVAYVFPLKGLSSPVEEIIAWRPLPEPYRPERSDNNDRE